MHYERDWMPVMVDTLCLFAIVPFESVMFTSRRWPLSFHSFVLVHSSRFEACCPSSGVAFLLPLVGNGGQRVLLLDGSLEISIDSNAVIRHSFLDIDQVG